VAHRAALDALQTEAFAVLLKEQLITLTRAAQDGTRVRASAGAASFRKLAPIWCPVPFFWPRMWAHLEPESACEFLLD